MNTNKFNRRSVRTLTQINTSSSQKIYGRASSSQKSPEERGRQSDKGRSYPRNEASGSQGRTQGFRERESAHSTMQSGMVPAGHIVQHVMVPIPVPVGSEINPHLFAQQILRNQYPHVSSFEPPGSKSQDSNRDRRDEKSADILDYYLSKDQGEKKVLVNRNYRQRHSSESSSRSSSRYGDKKDCDRKTSHSESTSRRERSHTYGPVPSRERSSRSERDRSRDMREREDGTRHSSFRQSDTLRHHSPESRHSYNSRHRSRSPRERGYDRETKTNTGRYGESPQRYSRSPSERSRTVNQPSHSFGMRDEQSRDSYSARAEHLRENDSARAEQSRHSYSERALSRRFDDSEDDERDIDENMHNVRDDERYRSQERSDARYVDSVSLEEEEEDLEDIRSNEDYRHRELVQLRREEELRREAILLQREIENERQLEVEEEIRQEKLRKIEELERARELERERELHDERDRQYERELRDRSHEIARERELEHELRESEILRLRQEEEEKEYLRKRERLEYERGHSSSDRNELAPKFLREDDLRYELERERELRRRAEYLEKERIEERLESEREYSDYDRFRRGKRSLSPVSDEFVGSRRGERPRDSSPVSTSISQEHFRVHVSDKGRFVERSEASLSPVSDEFEESVSRVSRERRSSYDRKIIDDRMFVSSQRSQRVDSYLHDTEMVSDEETDRYPNRMQENKHSQFNPYYNDFKLKLEKEMGECKPKHDIEKSLGRIRHQYLTEFKMYIRIPNTCDYYQNFKSGGCKNIFCKRLHICKSMVLENCKYGPKCVKSHDIATGQPCALLHKLNPNINLRKKSIFWKIMFVLQKRILIECGRRDLLEVIQQKFDERILTMIELEKETEYRSEMADRKYSGKAETHSRNATVVSIEMHENKPKTVSDTDRTETEREIEKKQSAVENVKKEKDDDELSAVSGEEGNWEDYEKYEKVSDDGMSEKVEDMDDLETVSSSGSHMSNYRAIEFSGPAPVPENIAVPIGMNEPLVFNRPLGNNPEKHVGPLNRPPPSVPLNLGQMKSQPPLFPILTSQPGPAPGFGVAGPSMSGQGKNLQNPVQSMPMPGFVPPPGFAMQAANFLGMGPGMPPMGAMANHLPSPEFMKQVFQQLQSQPMNTFKNENTPAIVECKEEKKQEEKDIDPDLKEPIKTLWNFPHKNPVSMSIIEFVTETEAYKEEFIAEIVRILVNLELPYVTMKKLISVIKEKLMINIKSQTDMRKILDLYPTNFQIEEEVYSDDEGEDDESKKLVKIRANVSVGFCEKHGFLPFAMGKCDCNSLHICKFFMLGKCTAKVCKFGHKLKTEHNIGVLKNNKLHRLTGEEVMRFISDVDNRNKGTVPVVCKYYVREKGCYKGNNTDPESICHDLHMCQYAIKSRCTNRECEKSHSIRDIQPHSLLVKFGLDPDELGDGRVMTMIREIAVAVDKEKELAKKSAKSKMGGLKAQRGVLISEKNQPMDSSLDSSIKGSENDNSRDNAIKKKIADLGKKVDFSVPAICKFYQNELGCRKKDWGPDGKCHFLHICQYFVIGECKFGFNCKRSHDLYSGQAVEILRKYQIDPDIFTKEEILVLLQKSSDAPILIPKEVREDSDDFESAGNTDNTLQQSENATSPEEPGVAYADKVIKSEPIEHSEDAPTSWQASFASQPGRGGTGKHPYQSCNIEDVIKHIMEERRVEPGTTGGVQPNIKQEPME